MTVGIDSWRMAFACDGVSNVFALAQLIYLAQTDLQVVLCDVDFDNRVPLALGGDYTLAGNGARANGVLTTLADDPYPQGKILVVVRNTDARQAASFNEGDGFPAKTAEGAFDRHSLLVMEALGRVFDLSLCAPPRETQTMNDLPIAKLRANFLLGFDAQGQPQMLDPATLGGGGGAPFLKRNVVGQTAPYTVTAADDFGYVEFDTALADRTVIFDPADTSIPDTTEVAFRKTSAAHGLYITTDGTLDTAVHNEQTLKKFSVRKVGNSLVL